MPMTIYPPLVVIFRHPSGYPLNISWAAAAAFAVLLNEEQ